MISTKSGIHAASRFLRHADIQVTAMYYADHKDRVTVDIGGMLKPENVDRITPSQKTSLTTAGIQKSNHSEAAG